MIIFTPTREGVGIPLRETETQRYYLPLCEDMVGGQVEAVLGGHELVHAQGVEVGEEVSLRQAWIQG